MSIQQFMYLLSVGKWNNISNQVPSRYFRAVWLCSVLEQSASDAWALQPHQQFSWLHKEVCVSCSWYYFPDHRQEQLGQLVRRNWWCVLWFFLFYLISLLCLSLLVSWKSWMCNVSHYILDVTLKHWVKKYGWRDEGNLIFIANQDENIKTKNITEKIEFDHLAPLMTLL